MKTRINKKLLIGVALALVLVSGAFINANAVCLNCQPQVRTSVQTPAQAGCPVPYHFGPTTPTPFGGVGAAAGG